MDRSQAHWGCLNPAQLSLSHYTLADAFRRGEMAGADLVRFAAENRIPAVELLDAFWYPPGTVRDHLPGAGWLADELASVAEACQQTGVLISSVAVTNDFASKEPDHIALQNSKIELGIAVADRFGGVPVRVFASHTEHEGVEALVTQNLKRFGSRVALENHGSVFADPARIARIAEATGCGICFDIGNFVLAEFDPVAAADCLPAPALIHLKDFRIDPSGPFVRSADRLRGCPLGEGLVPLGAVLDRLTISPSTRLVIELENLEKEEYGKLSVPAGL